MFGDGACTGNPVAVILDAKGLDDESVRRFPAWFTLSECTFILPPIAPEADCGVRTFGPGTELPFARPSTLGTARAWLYAGGRPKSPGLVVQVCGAGVVPVRIKRRVHHRYVVRTS